MATCPIPQTVVAVVLVAVVVVLVVVLVPVLVGGCSCVKGVACRQLIAI